MLNKTRTKEKSPYLLQHAYNPGDWYPWGEGAFDSAIGPTSEVIIVGDLQAGDTKNLILRSRFMPGRVVIFRPVESPEIVLLATRDLKGKDDKATAYVCRNFTCTFPTTDAEEMLALLKSQEKSI